MINLIQGFFFQERPGCGIAYDEVGARVFIRNVALRTMFSGVFGSDEDGSAVLVGRMTDHYGESILTDFEFDSADNLTFTKKYLNRDNLIQYRFRKYADGTWHGIYRGIMTGTGQACCVIMAVPDEFLLPKAETRLDVFEESPRRPIKRGGQRSNFHEKYRR